MDQVSATASTLGFGERMAHRLLTRSPLGLLVHWVAGIQASVHAKLLGGFLLVVLLFMAMGALSLQTIARMSRQSQLLHQAHERVDSSRQIEHALAMQMNFIAMALLLKDEDTIANFLRENNRFNNMLARLAEAAPPEEGQMIQRIRTAQDEILTTSASRTSHGRADPAAGQDAEPRRLRARPTARCGAGSATTTALGRSRGQRMTGVAFEMLVGQAGNCGERHARDCHQRLPPMVY